MSIDQRVFLLIFIIITRILLRLVSRNDGLFDTWFQIYLIHSIQDNNFKVPEEYTRILSRQKLSYPYYFHWIMAFIPRRYTTFIIYYFNILLDLIFGCFAAWLVFVMYHDINMALMALTLYLSTPLMFTTISMGLRAESYTPRLTGEICINLIAIIVILLNPEPNILSACFLIFLSILVCGGSQFSRQALILCFPMIFFLTDNGWAIAAIVCGLIGATMISGNRFTNSIKDKFIHYVWYIKQIRQKKILVSQRNWWGFINILTSQYGTKKIIDGLFWQAMKFNPLFVLIVKYPIIFILPFYYQLDAPLSKLEIADAEYQMFMIYISAMIIWFLTSTPYFLFLGESERYVLHFTLCIIILSVKFIPSNLIFICIVYGVIYCWLEVLYKINNLKKQKNINSSKQVYKFLNTLPENKRCATIPIALGGWGVLIHTKQNWLSPADVIYDYENANCFFDYQSIDLEKIDKAISYFDLDVIFVDEQRTRQKSHIVEINGFTKQHLTENVDVYIKN